MGMNRKDGSGEELNENEKLIKELNERDDDDWNRDSEEMENKKENCSGKSE
ncbi:hypothetical protein [Staphylococcus epidermidis]|uniref:hypothetical protein n=1 Tax=Staphylococcus epidermidis TaxID=1282 RepID=UPI0016432681|nr:hypothetical protein [Staphylococcus epidermidis]